MTRQQQRAQFRQTYRDRRLSMPRKYRHPPTYSQLAASCLKWGFNDEDLFEAQQAHVHMYDRPMVRESLADLHTPEKWEHGATHAVVQVEHGTISVRWPDGRRREWFAAAGRFNWVQTTLCRAFKLGAK